MNDKAGFDDHDEVVADDDKRATMEEFDNLIDELILHLKNNNGKNIREKVDHLKWTMYSYLEGGHYKVEVHFDMDGKSDDQLGSASYEQIYIETPSETSRHFHSDYEGKYAKMNELCNEVVSHFWRALGARVRTHSEALRRLLKE